MKAEKILFPTDFSESSDAALALSTSLARDMGALLIILHVEEPPIIYGELSAGVPEIFMTSAAAKLESVHPPDPNVPIERRLIGGNPASEIVRFAADEGVDLIVMGTHGRSGLSRLLMGSVAELVVRAAACPVLTVKQPASKKTQSIPRVEVAL
jgi:nucleotide-binding universal stress UspA family protein